MPDYEFLTRRYLYSLYIDNPYIELWRLDYLTVNEIPSYHLAIPQGFTTIGFLYVFRNVNKMFVTDIEGFYCIGPSGDTVYFAVKENTDAL